VISEFADGSGYSTKDEFIELYNPTARSVDISEWRIQFKTTGENKNWRTRVKIPVGTIMQPYSFYLLANSKYTGPEADFTRYFSWGFLSRQGSFRLTDYEGEEIDRIGYGEDSSDYEGPEPLIDEGEGESFARRGYGYDTDNNKNDFIPAKKRNPQTSRSIPEIPEFALKEKHKWSPADESTLAGTENDIINIDELYLQSRADLRDGRIFDCMEKLEKIILINSEYVKSENDLENIPQKIKNDLEKKNLIGRDRFYGEAVLYYLQNDHKSASDNLKKVLLLTPDDKEVRKWYEKIRPPVEKVEEPEPASPVIEKVEEKKEDAPLKPVVKKEETPQPAKPKKSSRKKDIEEAEKHYEQGLREYASGYVSKAIEEWELCLKYNPDHQRAKNALRKARKH